MEHLISTDELVLDPTIKVINTVLKRAAGQSHGAFSLSYEVLPKDHRRRLMLYKLLRKQGYDLKQLPDRLNIWWN